MKRFLSAITALSLVFSLTACSDSAKDKKKDQLTTKPVVIDTTVLTHETETPFATEPTAELSTEEALTESNTKENETTTKAGNKNENKNPTTQKPSATTEKVTNKPVPTTKKPEPTTSASSKKLPNYTPEAEIVTLFNKINGYRQQKGLNKLTLDPELCKMAYIRAQEQKVLKGHTRPDNSKYYSILDEYNYSYMGCGENIAFFPDLVPDDIFNKWKGSSQHDSNMVNSNWTKSGIALCKNIDGTYIVVHLFAC